MHSRIKYIATLMVTIALSACGGGGGGATSPGPTPTPPNSAPVANAGVNQSVDEQTTVTLDGTASSDPDGNNNLTYNWTQAEGVSVMLSNGASAQPSFDGPDVGIGSSTTLTFRLSVTDPDGANSTSTVDVIVNGVTNTDPVVNAGNDQAATERMTVNLIGTASDTDIGDSLSFSWTETTGSGATITNSDMASASFEAPAVGAGGETLTFELAVNDGNTTVTDTVNVSVSEAAIAVSISGKVQYEFVPPNFNCTGLNFLLTETRPIRAATVQLIDDATGNEIDSIVAAPNGDYSFNNVAVNLDVRIRVRAELKRSGAPSWDVEVRDNVDISQNPPPLGSRPLYVVDSAAFNTGGADITRDLIATTGWNGASYTGPRAAAPFAILDAIYAAMELIVTVDPVAKIEPLDAFWSVNNKKVPDNPDFDTGELTSAFYRSDLAALFLFGDEGTETDEFDDHLVLHEWTHHFDDTNSRSDSIGGSHFLGESLDLRLAFGEGFAHALAAIVLDEPQYCDTGAVPSGAGGFGFNTENNTSGVRGWFNEMSVATFIYDLWDTGSDGGADTGSIGFKPIYDTMTGPQKETPAFTTIFSFAAELKAMLSDADRAFVDAQLNRENIDAPNGDIWGDGQVTTPSGARNSGRDLTPIYTEIPTDGTGSARVCINNDYVSDDVVNKLSDWRYLRFELPIAGRWQITAQANPVPPPTENDPRPPPDDPDGVPQIPRDRSDPDLYIYRNGVLVTFGRSPDDDVEIVDHTFEEGTYVIEMQEWRHEDDGAASDFPGVATDFPDRVCFDLSMVEL